MAILFDRKRAKCLSILNTYLGKPVFKKDPPKLGLAQIRVTTPSVFWELVEPFFCSTKFCDNLTKPLKEKMCKNCLTSLIGHKRVLNKWFH